MFIIISVIIITIIIIIIISHLFNVGKVGYTILVYCKK